MTSAQKKSLKKLAHPLNPVVFIGHQGVTESVIVKTTEGLLSHELIKVKFSDHKTEKQSMVESLASSTNSTLVDIIGHVAILYCPHPDPEKRKIRV